MRHLPLQGSTENMCGRRRAAIATQAWQMHIKKAAPESAAFETEIGG
jgi:hypothetical protein